jgi:DNA-binding NarL/FixJ family response regulator
MSPLSQREAEVLERVRLGRTTKEIAAELGISTSTVIWHRKLALARQTAATPTDRAARARPVVGRRSV